MEVGARDVQGLPPLAQPAPRQSYAPMAGKPAPSSHEPPRQWNQAPTTLIYQWRKKRGGGRDGGKRTIQRPNEENGRQENTVLRTWRWCEQGWPRLSQTTYRWPRPRSLLLTVLKRFYLTSLKTLPSTVPLVFISSATSSLSVLPSSMFFASQRPHENLPRNTMHTVTSYRDADN